MVEQAKLVWKEATKRAGKFFWKRLREPSSWRGFVLLATVGLGWDSIAQPSKTEAIVFFGLFLVGLIGAITPDTSDDE